MVEVYQQENVYLSHDFLVQRKHEAAPAVLRSITTSMKPRVLTKYYINWKRFHPW